ncbi:hypothetical protein [Klebsiella phage phiKp_21]|uniref:hypothetical protein n=1 Tax=Klebsiella phage K64-1 TaxID=1439894 RepID=UPI00248ACACF|nr:hypothetical protein ACQ27_gp353 [Klebsiella phage K64-1]BEH88283.1 hypothetical protein [Klebsiella phage phiKp_21]
MFALQNKNTKQIMKVSYYFTNSDAGVEFDSHGDYFYLENDREELEKLLEFYREEGKITQFDDYPECGVGELDGYEIVEIELVVK